MNELNKPRGTAADYKSGSAIYSNKQFVFELIKKNPQVGNNSLGNPIPGMRTKEGKTMDFPLSVSIPLVGTVYFIDAKGRTYPRKIRYADGENSIYVDEQQPEDKVKHVEVRVNFVKGRFAIDGQNSTLLDFFMTWDMNESKPERDKKKFPKFKLVDTTKAAEKARKADEVVFDVLNWCYTADFAKKILPLAHAIFTEDQTTRKEAEIRHDLVVTAKRDPAAFQEMLDNPKMERLIVIKAAIMNDVLVVNSSANALCWMDNPSAFISQAAPGKEVIDDFISKSFSSAGEVAYKAIYDIMNPVDGDGVFDVATTTKVYQAPIVKGATETDEELTTLVREAVEKGIVVVKRNVWWGFKGKNSQGEKGMVKDLRDNEIMLSILKKNVLEWEKPVEA